MLLFHVIQLWLLSLLHVLKISLIRLIWLEILNILINILGSARKIFILCGCLPNLMLHIYIILLLGPRKNTRWYINHLLIWEFIGHLINVLVCGLLLKDLWGILRRINWNTWRHYIRTRYSFNDMRHLLLIWIIGLSYIRLASEWCSIDFLCSLQYFLILNLNYIIWHTNTLIHWPIASLSAYVFPS